MHDRAIRYRTARPDLSHLPIDKYSWDNSVYGDVKEDIPNDIAEAKGNTVDTITSVDGNLLHDMISSKSVTGVMHFLNQTPIDSYSKKQNKVETLIFSSKFVVAKIATEQIIDLRLMLMYMGVPVERSVMFSDNESVIKNGTIPHSKLNK